MEDSNQAKSTKYKTGLSSTYETPYINNEDRLGPNTRKCTFGHERQAETQISLRIRAVWSESSMDALWVAKVSSGGQQEPDAQADLSLFWAYMFVCTLSWVAAYFPMSIKIKIKSGNPYAEGTKLVIWPMHFYSFLIFFLRQCFVFFIFYWLQITDFSQNSCENSEILKPWNLFKTYYQYI